MSETKVDETPAPPVTGVCTVIPSSGAILSPVVFVVTGMALKEGWLLLTDDEGVERLFPSGYNGRVVIAPHTVAKQEPKQ